MSAQLTSGQLAYRDALAGYTGLDKGVLTAWLLSEESGSAAAARQQSGDNNWLNIGPGRFYASPQEGAQAAARLLNTSSLYAGIRAAASGTPAQQLAAISASPWDAGHYGGDGHLLRDVYVSLGGHVPAGAGPASIGAGGTGAGGTGGITGASFSQGLLKLGLQAALIGGGGWLVYTGARTAMAPVGAPA